MEYGDYKLHQKYGQCLAYLRLPDAANKVYDVALSLNPNSFTVHDSVAWHSFYIQQNEAAIYHWDRCLELAADRMNPNSFNSYAKCHDALGHKEIAEKYYKMALQHDNRNSKRRSAGYHSSFGQFLLKHHRIKEAKVEFECADHLNPPNKAYVHWKLAVIYNLMNNQHQRNLYLKQALELNPDLKGAVSDWNRWNLDCERPVARDDIKSNQRDENDDLKENEAVAVHRELTRIDISDEAEVRVQSDPSTSTMSDAYTTASMYHPTNEHEKDVEYPQQHRVISLFFILFLF